MSPEFVVQRQIFCNTGFPYLIPNATNREARLLIVAVPVDDASAVCHAAVPGIATRDIRTPPVSVVANVVEQPCVVTIAARKSCKAATVRGIKVGSIP